MDDRNKQKNPKREQVHNGENPLYHDGYRTLHNYLHTTRTLSPSCIIFPSNTPHHEFKAGMIQLLPTFHGLENKNSYVHIREFEEVKATFQGQPQTLDTVMLKFISLSLKDKAKTWLYTLRPMSKVHVGPDD